MQRCILLFSLAVDLTFGANILFATMCASPSHHFWNRVLAIELAKRGHNITMISHDKEKTPTKNFHLIYIEGVYTHSSYLVNLDELYDISHFEHIKLIYDWSYGICEFDFQSPALQTLLNYPKDFKFDLIVFDMTTSLCMYPIIDRFNKPPVVGVSGFLLPPVLSHTFGNPTQPTYFPFFTTNHDDKMTFKERFFNSILFYFDILYRNYVSIPNEETLARKHFKHDFRPFKEIERDISLLLCNIDPMLDHPLDLPPNIIPVGGMHITPNKSLPEDIQKIADSAEDGFIVFTLGTNLKSTDMKPEKRSELLRAFARLPQVVFWKFEVDDVGIELPKNVHIRKWLPQSDLLAHPNAKVFITHGGAMGTREAMSRGVPIVGIPFLADQHANTRRLVKRKMGLKLFYGDLAEENVYQTLKEVIYNPEYAQNIKRLSRTYLDQPNTPLERAAFWVEYVLRHGTAEHLNLAARDMSFFQVHGLDILAVLLLGIVAVYAAISFLFACAKLLLTKKIKQS